MSVSRHIVRKSFLFPLHCVSLREKCHKPARIWITFSKHATESYFFCLGFMGTKHNLQQWPHKLVNPLPSPPPNLYIYIYIYIVQNLQKQDTPQSQQNIESKDSAKRIFRAYSLTLYKLVKGNVFFMTSSTLKLFQQIVNHELISY